MPKVRVSAVRFRSLLANRHMTPDSVVMRASTIVRPHDLAAGDQELEFEDLVALAKVFARPWSYLLIDDPEVYPSAGSDNRTYENQNVFLSPELLAELQIADLMLDAATDLFPGEGYRTPAVRTSKVPVADLAAAIRTFLGVSLDQQTAAKDEFAALRLWVTALNRNGVYISQRSLKDPTVRAFSKVKGDQAVIVVSTKDDPHPRIFSLLHEYCHVVVHSAGICDLLDHSKVERYCNAVSARVLLPDELLQRADIAQQLLGSEDDADAALRRFSNKAHVSQQAILIALRERLLIADDLYERLEARRASRRKNGKKASKGKPTYYRVAINQAGRMFSHRVIDAMREGVIDRQDASVLLGIGEQNVGKFVTALGSGE